MLSKKKNEMFHVGLIGDGVRRWARRNDVELAEAYLEAMKNVALFVDFFFSQQANIISLYLLSKENLGRPIQDLQAAIDGETVFLKTLLREAVEKWKCQVCLAGTAELLPEKYVRAIWDLQNLPHDGNRKIYLLAAYNPLDEIHQAVAKGNLEENLWVCEPVDIVVRTSGEYRISNFLPLQIAYAELFFINRHINDLSIKDCISVLEQYQNRRDRRFGK